MGRTLFALGLCLSLTGAAMGQEAVEAVSENPHHFRLELATPSGPPEGFDPEEDPPPDVDPGKEPPPGEDFDSEKVKVIPGWLDESGGTGKGYDLAVLDWDGDGKPERKVPFPSSVFPPTGEKMVSPQLRLEHEGSLFEITFDDLAEVAKREPNQRGRLKFSWTVEAAAHLRFADASLWVSRTAQGVGENETIRLGPPFDLVPRVMARGRRAVLAVMLMDGNGGRLCMSFDDEGVREPSLDLYAGEEKKLSQALEFDEMGDEGLSALPLDVPTGTYRIVCRFDMSPMFGDAEHMDEIEVTQPPPDVLEKTLAALGSADAEVRRDAAGELKWFAEDAAQVLPALLARLWDEDASVIGIAVASVRHFREDFGKHMEKAILAASGGGGIQFLGRIYALDLLGNFAPRDPKVESALEKATESEDEKVRNAAIRALESYRILNEPPEEGD